MKYIAAFIIPLLFISSCKPSVVKQSFSSPDSLVVYFKNEQAGTITKTVQTTEAKAIRRMIEFIDNQPSGEFQCGYDGKMFFYEKGKQVQEVDFKMKADSCNHFSFLLDGKIMNTKMSHEAIDFFDALEAGLPYYY